MSVHLQSVQLITDKLTKLHLSEHIVIPARQEIVLHVVGQYQVLNYIVSTFTLPSHKFG